MYIVTPSNRKLGLLLTLRTPLVHGDPSAQGDTGNFKGLNRQKRKLERAAVIGVESLHTVVRSIPVPDHIKTMVEQSGVNAYEFAGVALTVAFIRDYGRGEGEGLFTGSSRYAMLESRMAQAATRSQTLFRYWSVMIQSLQLRTRESKSEWLLSLLMVQPQAAGLVLDAILNNTPTIILLARSWWDAIKPKAGELDVQQAIGDNKLRLPTPNLDAREIVLDVPHYSANSARHELIREPGTLHLLSALGLTLDELPPSVASLFYNGGSLSTSAPSGVYRLQQAIKAAYPLLGLIGGSTDGFLVGTSEIDVNTFVVCTENAKELNAWGLEPQHSAFDMLDLQTHTRHNGGRIDDSPMPYSFESMMPGSQIVVEIAIRPYAQPLQLGALAAALNTYIAMDSTIGGQGAKGYGSVDVALLSEYHVQQYLADYETHIAMSADKLRLGLLDGTLATGAVVCGK
ncbi:MAG: hypothetical protein ACOYL5_17770 [Phototrophicaceae bacterium]